MKNVMQVLVVIFLLVLMTGIVICQKNRIKDISFSYKENQESLQNPARGFYEQLYVSSPKDAVKRVAKDSDVKIILLTMDLSEYVNEDISSEALDALEEKLVQCKDADMMVIFRASYKQKGEDAEPDLECIASHIKQLSAVLNTHQDVVFAVQAGMLGLWGEWHTSKYLPDDGSLSKESIQVIQCWLNELDESIVLNLRRPSFIREAMENGVDGTRLGYHDDGLLGSDTDLGTYITLDREQELSWAKENLNGKINGGEMPYVTEFTQFENVKKEFDELSITYLNYYYNKQVLQSWNADELQFVRDHLGYRYSLDCITLPETLKRDFSFHVNENIATIPVDIDLRNTGFSSIAARFKPYLVVRYENGEIETYPLEKKQDKKAKEKLVAKIKVNCDQNFILGIQYSDGVHNVLLANDEVVFENGVNEVIAYDVQEKNWCKLK